MICRNCRNEVPEGSTICPICGANLEVAAAQADKMEEVKNSDTMKKLPFAIAMGVVALVALIILLGRLPSIFMGAQKKVVSDYMNATKKGKYKKVAELTVPKDVREDLEDILGMDWDDYVDELEEEFDDLPKSVKKAKYKVGKSENLDKLDDLEKKSNYDDLDDFREAFEKHFGKDVDGDDISKAYIVEVKVSYDGDSTKTYMYSYKYNGKWYVWV